jgi:hypothetical protein
MRARYDGERESSVYMLMAPSPVEKMLALGSWYPRLGVSIGSPGKIVSALADSGVRKACGRVSFDTCSSRSSSAHVTSSAPCPPPSDCSQSSSSRLSKAGGLGKSQDALEAWHAPHGLLRSHLIFLATHREHER